MFDILDRPFLWIPVRWPSLRPGGANGEGVAEAVEIGIELQVELLDADAVKPLVDPEDGEQLDKVDAFLLVVKDWRRIVSGGQPLPFAKPAAQALIKKELPFFDAFRVAYVQACLGRVETRAGNSESSPGNGRAVKAVAKTTATGNRKRRRTADASA